MLILTRRVDEHIRIGDDIIVTVVRINRGQVSLGISAPRDVAVHREEVYGRLREEAAAGGEAPASGSKKVSDSGNERSR